MMVSAKALIIQLAAEASAVCLENALYPMDSPKARASRKFHMQDNN